jgi:hypothetical protein
MDTSLGYCNSSLFHHFMNSSSVNVGHLVKFINAHNTSVSQNHGSSFKPENKEGISL